MNILTAAKGAILALALAAPAGATTLDFSGFPTGNLHTTVLLLPEVTIATGGDSLFNIPGAGLCAFNNAFNCAANLNLTFVGEVSNLSFEAFGYDPGDSVLAQVFNAGGTLLASFSIVGNGTYDFGSLGGIARLFLEDSSTGAGYSWNNFTFDNAPAAIPLPATLPLLAGAMALGGVVLRRRKA